MRKCAAIFLIFIFTLCFAPKLCNAATKGPVVKRKIEFISKDKFILVGDIYLTNPKTDKPLVVLLHSFSMSARSWQPLADILRERGYNVLAMDIRGHGRSVYNESLKQKSRYSFDKKDWQKLPSDVLESIDYVKKNYPNVNTKDTVMVGADIGASAGIIAGEALKNQPQKFVLISPMVNFKGLYIPVKIANYTQTKFFIMLSKSDKVLFNFYTEQKPVVKTYPLGGPGNQLLKYNSGAVDDIVNFIVN